MRKWVVVLAAVLVLLGSVLAWTGLRLNAFLAENHDWLAQRAGEALGREVHFDAIGVSLRGGLGARVTGLRVGEAPGFGDEPFLSVATATVRVDPWPALRGKYRISGISLQAPQVRIVRTSAGFNVTGLGGVGESRSGAHPPAGGKDGARAPQVVWVSVDGGTIRWLDRTTRPAREIGIADVGLIASGIGGPDPVRIEGAARLFGTGGQDVSVDGTVGVAGLALVIDATDAEIGWGDSIRKPAGLVLRLDGRADRSGDDWHVRDSRLQVVDAMLDIAGTVRATPTTRVDLRIGGEAVPLAGWDRLFPALAGFELSGHATPKLALAGSDRLQLIGELGFQEAGLKNDGLRVTGVGTTVAIDENGFTVPHSEIDLNGAPLVLSGQGDLGLRSWNVAGTVTGLVLGPLLERYAPEVARLLDGVLDADLELGGGGTAWAEIREVVAGAGQVTVRDGVLRQFNLAEEVLVGLTGLKGLTSLISPRIRAAHPGLLQAEDTPFEEFGSHLRAGGGKVTLEDFALAAREIDVRGEGWVSFGGKVDVAGTLTASTALSADLVRSVEELRPLLDDHERLRVPFLMKGRLPEVRPQPDLDHVVGKLGRSALESGLNRIFGGKDKDAGQAEARDQETIGPTPRLEEQLLRRGLDALFGR
jgi:hypothetical protein